MARPERLRRKDLRQPDEFLTLSRRAVAFSEANRTTMLVALGAIVVLLIAVTAYRVVRSSREAAAADSYRRAHALLDERKHGEAADAFRDTAGTYGSTSWAPLAQLEMANALLLAERSAEAVQAYEDFLSRGAPTEYLRQVALVRLGHAREQSDAPAEAMDAYAQAAGLAGPYAEDALLGQARTAEAKGDPQQARGLYEQFFEKYPESDRRELVTARLIALGWHPPVENPAPGAAAEPTDADS